MTDYDNTTSVLSISQKKSTIVKKLLIYFLN